MKKAVYYARVSSDLQREKGTIDSQIAELKKQIAAAGDVLVKEYIDNGFSGARLDRPAMDELRKDIKTNEFDTIYFLNADRIAREVTYQTIIISEMLKHGKQIIINGKDYIHNPENKFALTVLGAVSELERAKMLERVTRGKAMKLARGQLLGLGINIYGYNYYRKTHTTEPRFEINEEEAKTVRYIFETYAKGGIGMWPLIRQIEDMGIPTKTGKKLWRTGIIKGMLKNPTYMGMRYFHRTKLIREYANPVYGIKRSTKKLIPLDKSQWIGIPVPAIISKELFEKVQKRIEWNRSRYRNPRKTQLLSTLIKCGGCGDGFFGYCRYYKVKLVNGTEKLYFRASYKCNWRHLARMHSKNSTLTKDRCGNKEILTDLLEEKVMQAIKETMLNPNKLKACMAILRERKQSVQIRLQRKINRLDKKLSAVKEKKQRIMELYASKEIDREAYAQKSTVYDQEINALNAEKYEITKQIPVMHKAEVVDASIKQFCHGAQLRLEKCVDFDTKRQFFLDYIEKVVYFIDKASIHGFVPVQGGTEEDNSKIEFKIPFEIPKADRIARYIPHRSGHTLIKLPQFNGFLN